MANQGWHSILQKAEQGNSTSFIGGKPCIAPSIPLPICKICGEPLTFFFQVAFPEGHIWTGKSLALFFCSATYQKHKDEEKLPVPVTRTDWHNFDIRGGELEPDTYQTMFRTIIFDTQDGIVRDEYEERIAYQEIIWKPSKAKGKKVPIILGGEPIWMQYGKERPATYDGKPMDLILQVAENFNFDKLPNAPAEMRKAFLGSKPFVPRKEPNYTLFFAFNRVYLWGTVDPADPAVYLSVQNNV